MIMYKLTVATASEPCPKKIGEGGWAEMNTLLTKELRKYPTFDGRAQLIWVGKQARVITDDGRWTVYQIQTECAKVNGMERQYGL